MQRWMCGVTTRDKNRNEHIRGTDNKSGASVQENHRKTTEVVRPCKENERRAHSEKNVKCAHTGEKKEKDGQTYDGKMHARETWQRLVLRGQHDKQGSFDE